jgi:hypothetical protein
MHIHKLLAVISVAAIAGSASLKAQNNDTEAQAQAREALRQTISQLNNGATNAAPAAPVPATPPSEPAPTPAPGPALAPTPVAPAPADAAAPAVAPATSQLTPEQEQLLLQQERELVHGHSQNQPNATVNAATTPAESVPAIAPAAAAPAPMALPQTSTMVTGTPVPMGSNLTPAQEDQLLTQERELINKRNRQNPNGGNADWPSAETASQMVSTDLTLKTGSKQQRLDELLQLYRDDTITPLQYHQQRAKIIAEP